MPAATRGLVFDFVGVPMVSPSALSMASFLTLYGRQVPGPSYGKLNRRSDTAMRTGPSSFEDKPEYSTSENGLQVIAAEDLVASFVGCPPKHSLTFHQDIS